MAIPQSRNPTFQSLFVGFPRSLSRSLGMTTKMQTVLISIYLTYPILSIHDCVYILYTLYIRGIPCLLRSCPNLLRCCQNLDFGYSTHALADLAYNSHATAPGERSDWLSATAGIATVAWSLPRNDCGVEERADRE